MSTTAAFFLSPNQLEYERKKQEKENRISRLKQVESLDDWMKRLLKGICVVGSSKSQGNIIWNPQDVSPSITARVGGAT